MLASVALLLASLAAARAEAPAPLDLDDPAQATLAFVRARASSDPAREVFVHWSGTIHELIPGQAAGREPLLRFEGFNVARVVPGEGGGWRLVSREITVYQDSQGRILDCWVDPSAPGEPPRPVLHTANDPVSFDLRTPAHRTLDDRVLWSVTIPLAYPSPLPVAEHPQASASDLYQSVEIFDFEASLAELGDPALPSVPVRVAWTRAGQWLPWMGRGQQPGWLVYHATGHKLAGWEELPEPLRAWVLERAPEYQHAPEEDVGPNRTSWKSWAAAAEAGALPEGCGD
jgi:hypothetical protein